MCRWQGMPGWCMRCAANWVCDGNWRGTGVRRWTVRWGGGSIRWRASLGWTPAGERAAAWWLGGTRGWAMIHWPVGTRGCTATYQPARAGGWAAMLWLGQAKEWVAA